MISTSAACSQYLLNGNAPARVMALAAFVVTLKHEAPELLVQGPQNLGSDNGADLMISKNRVGIAHIEMRLNNIAFETVYAIELLSLPDDIGAWPYLGQDGQMFSSATQAEWRLPYGADPIKFGTDMARKFLTCGLAHYDRRSGYEPFCNNCSYQLRCLSVATPIQTD